MCGLTPWFSISTMYSVKAAAAWSSSLSLSYSLRQHNTTRTSTSTTGTQCRIQPIGVFNIKSLAVMFNHPAIHKDYSYVYPPLSTARHSFIQAAEVFLNLVLKLKQHLQKSHFKKGYFNMLPTGFFKVFYQLWIICEGKKLILKYVNEVYTSAQFLFM